MADRATPPSRLPPEPRYETSDVSVRIVVGFALGLVVAGVAIAFVVSGLIRAFGRPTEGPASRPPTVESMQTPIRASAPSPEAELLRELRASEDRTLQTYGWVDRKDRVVRIPIDRAMDVLVKRGVGAAEPRSRSER